MDEKEEDGVVGRGMSHCVLSFMIRIHDGHRYAGLRRPIMRLRRLIAVEMTRATFWKPLYGRPFVYGFVKSDT